ncbi:hypothetical protein MASR2M54_21030 [Aliarcobacter cryaerophilus]
MVKMKNRETLKQRGYQRKAVWTIISQRNATLKHEAIESLETLEKLLFSHNEDNVPLWLWHFYNIKANLMRMGREL